MLIVTPTCWECPDTWKRSAQDLNQSCRCRSHGLKDLLVCEEGGTYAGCVVRDDGDCLILKTCLPGKRHLRQACHPDHRSDHGRIHADFLWRFEAWAFTPPVHFAH